MYYIKRISKLRNYPETEILRKKIPAPVYVYHLKFISKSSVVGVKINVLAFRYFVQALLKVIDLDTIMAKRKD